MLFKILTSRLFALAVAVAMGFLALFAYAGTIDIPHYLAFVLWPGSKLVASLKSIHSAPPHVFRYTYIFACAIFWGVATRLIQLASKLLGALV